MGPGALRGAFTDTWHRQGDAWGTFGGGHEENPRKSLLCGKFREFTRGRERLTLQSYRFQVRLLLTAGTRSLPREQPGYLRS